MERYPIAYIRRSSADANDPGDVSREAQESAVHELARREGHNGDLRIVTDWDRSADESKESRRAAFLAMLAAIERGEVSAVYAASLDRLYRSLRTFVRLTDAAKAHDVRIVTLREGVLGGDGSPMAQAFAEITAVFSGLELRTTKARAAGALAVRQARGDHIGRVGYGYLLARNERGAVVAVPDPDHPLAPIVAAVREAGSILGGCKLLMAHGIPAPDGGTAWGSTTLRRIIEHAAPELLPTAGPTGRRTPAHSALAQLLLCHCGHVLTPEPKRHSYRCTIGNRRGREAHGPVWVSERAILPWIKAEAARLRVPHRDLELDADPGIRASLEAQRRAVGDALVIGAYTKEQAAAKVVELTAEMDDIDIRDRAEAIAQTVKWTWPPEQINAVLRGMWAYVELGPDLRPTRAEWTVPEWRA